MAKKPTSTKPSTPLFLKEWRKHRGLTQEQVADRLGMDKGSISRLESGYTSFTSGTLAAVARVLGIEPRDLFHEPSASVAERGEIFSNKSVAGIFESKLSSAGRGKRTDGQSEPLTELVYVIGKVQAGAWMEAYDLQRSEWEEMPQPADPRFPGIQRYALRNVGESMNQVCPDGGIWVYVRFIDLTGQGPQPGNFVIVERRRGDLVEATAKQFRLDPNGRPGLYPCSTDSSFQPIALDGAEHDVEEIRIIGRVTDIQRRV